MEQYFRLTSPLVNPTRGGSLRMTWTRSPPSPLDPIEQFLILLVASWIGRRQG
jgi:hypothetical protein